MWGAVSGAEPLFHALPLVVFFASLKSFTLRHWDEQQHERVGSGALGSLKLVIETDSAGGPASGKCRIINVGTR